MKRALALALVAQCAIGAAAMAASVEMSVQITDNGNGTWTYDFTLKNNLDPSYGQGLYFTGVDFPDDPSQQNPGGTWFDWGTGWSNAGYGGSNIVYDTCWLTGDYLGDGVTSGESLSGFKVTQPFLDNDINFYAFGYDNGVGPGYFEQDAFNHGHNPGFEGKVVPAPATIGLLGLAGLVARRRR